MTESEIRREMIAMLTGAGLGTALAEQITGRLMDMVEEYGGELASEAASDAIREYEERY
jgi:hypothetical protein